jgi:hypothetical protein
MEPGFLIAQEAERKRKEEERKKAEALEKRVKEREAYLADTPEARAKRRQDYARQQKAQEVSKSRLSGNSTLPGPRVGRIPDFAEKPFVAPVRASYLQFLKEEKEEPIVTRTRTLVPPQEMAGLSSVDKGVDAESFTKDFNSRYGKYGLVANSGAGGVNVSTLDGKKSMSLTGVLGKVAGGSDNLKQFISSNATRDVMSDLGFQEKAKLAKQQRPVSRVNNDGTQSSHLYESAEVGGKFVVYPTLFPKSPDASSDAKDWMELGSDQAYSEAKKRGEVIEFNNKASADAFAKGAWKKSVDPGEELNRRVFKQKGVEYDQFAAAKRKQTEIEEQIAEINAFEEGEGSATAMRAKYGKDLKAAKTKLIEERNALYESLSQDKVREAIEESSRQQQAEVARLREEAKGDRKRSGEIISEINGYTRSRFGEDFADPNTFQINKKMLKLQETNPEEFASIVKNYNVALNTYKMGSDKAFTEKTYLTAQLDKYARERYESNVKSFSNSILSSYKEGKMKKLMAQSLLADQNADPQDPELAKRLALMAAANVPDDISIDQKRINEAIETNNWEGIWDALSDSPAGAMEGIASAVLGSLSQVLPIMLDVVPLSVAGSTLVGGAAGSFRGGLPGIVAGALKGAVEGLTYGQAMSQFALEVGDAMLSKAREKYDLTDTNQAAMALRDPEVIEAARTTGLARGGTIAAVDLLTSKLTSRLNLVKPLASRSSRVAGTIAAKTAIDIPSEMVGEYLAQKVAGQSISEAEVIMEGVGAFGMNTPTTAVAIYKQSRGDYYANIADKMSKSVEFIGRMNEDLGNVVNWTNNMRQTGQIDAQKQQDILLNVASIREARTMMSSTNPNATQRANQLFFGTGTKAEERLARLVRAKNALSANPTANNTVLSEIDQEINYIVQNKEVAPRGQTVDLSSIVPQETLYFLNGRAVLVDEMENFISSGKDGDKDINESDVVILGDDRMRNLLADAKKLGAGLNLDEYDDQEAITISADSKEELPARFRDEATYNESEKKWEVKTNREKAKAAPMRGPVTRVVSDDVYAAFQEDKASVPEDVLNGIAQARSNGEPLTERQEEIYQEYKDQIQEYEDLSGVISSPQSDIDEATAAIDSGEKNVYAIDRRTGSRFSVSNKEDLAKAGARGMKIITSKNKISGAMDFSRRALKSVADEVRTAKYAGDLLSVMNLKKEDYQRAIEAIAKAVEDGADIDSAMNSAINELNKRVGVGKWDANRFSTIIRNVTGMKVSAANLTKSMRVEGPGIEQKDAVNSTKYIVPMLKLLSKKFGTKYQIINDPAIMKNGWVDYSGQEPVIYVNMAYPTIDVAAHEYGHIFIDLLRVHNLNVYKDLLKEIFGGVAKTTVSDSDYQKFLDEKYVPMSIFNGIEKKMRDNEPLDVRQKEMYKAVMEGNASTDKPEIDQERRIVQRLYPELNLLDRDEEVMVRLLGRLAAKEFEKNSSIYDSLMKLWRAIYNLIRSAIEISISDIVVPPTAGPNVTLEFLAKSMINPRIVFTDRTKAQAGYPAWATEMKQSYQRAISSFLGMYSSPNSEMLTLRTGSGTGYAMVFEDANEARRIANEYHGNMMSVLESALSYVRMTSREKIVSDLIAVAKEDPSVKNDGLQGNPFKFGSFDETFIEEISSKVVDAFEGRGEMPEPQFLLISLLSINVRQGVVEQLYGSMSLEETDEGIVSSSNNIEDVRILEKIESIVGEAIDNFSELHSKDSIYTASQLAATTPFDNFYQSISDPVSPSAPRDDMARVFKAPSDNVNRDLVRVLEDSTSTVIRDYRNRMAAKMSFTLIPFSENDIQRRIETYRNDVVRSEPIRSFLRTSTYDRIDATTLSDLLTNVSNEFIDSAVSGASASNNERKSIIFVEVPEKRDSNGNITQQREIVKYAVGTRLRRDNIIYVAFQVMGHASGESYPKLDNAMYAMPAVAKAIIKMWEGVPIAGFTFTAASTGATSYNPDGTEKRSAADQRTLTYNRFAERIFGIYYNAPADPENVMIPEAFRPVISTSGRTTKDSRVDIDLARDGSGISLNGTPDEEMAGQVLPPSFKESTKAGAPAVFPDEYRASDVLSETHASDSRFITLMTTWASGIHRYVKKSTKEVVLFNLPFGNKDIYDKLSELRIRYKQEKNDKKKKEIVDEMNIIAKEYYTSVILGMTENLLATFDSLTEEFKSKAKDWYIGANRTANFLAKKYNVSLEQSSAILAVFSPKKEWFNNIADAERFLDVMQNDLDTTFTREMADRMIARLTKNKVTSLKNALKPAKKKKKDSKEKDEDSVSDGIRKFALLIDAIFKKYGEVSLSKMAESGTSEEARAVLIRAFMSLNYPKSTYGMFNPDGTFDQFSTSSFSENSYENMGKAMRVYFDGSLQNIHQELGNANKIRNFYNNIIDPKNPRAYVTADTHAISGAVGTSVSADEASGTGLFDEGLAPIYAMVKEAYVLVSEVTDGMYSPREIQSIVWEAVRTGINNKDRTTETKKRILDAAMKKDKKSQYERTTEIINDNRSEDPTWGGGNIKIQVPDFLQGLRDRAKSRKREILSKWRGIIRGFRPAARVGSETAVKSSADYSFLNSQGSIKRSMQIARMLQRAFPDAVVFMSESEWDAMVPELNIQANGAYGVTKNGMVYINPSVHKTDEAMYNTLIHEFGHLWLNYIKVHNKTLYKKGISLAMEMEDVKSGKKSAEEMLAVLIGDKGQSYILEAAEERRIRTKKSYTNFIGEFYDMLRKTFRFLRGMSDNEIESLTMDEFIGGALSDLFSGVPIPLDTSAFEATFSTEPQFRETESVYEMVSRARIEGYKDSEIARMLEKSLPATPDRKDIIIDALRVMPFDLFNEFPDSFKNVPGGLVQGQAILTSVMNEVKKFARTSVGGKKPSMAKVRQFALTELGKMDGFKDSPESLRTQMMMDLDSIVNISENKAIQNRMKEYAKKLRNMKKGARELAKIKKEMVSLIRAGLPKSVYTRSDVMTLLKKLNEATYDNIKQVQDEVFEFVTSIKVRDLKAKIAKQLDFATTRVEYNKRKGRATIQLQDSLAFVNQNFLDDNASPQQIEEKIYELNQIASSTQNPDILILANAAIAYNSSLLLDDTDFAKFQGLADVSAFLKGIIDEENAVFKQIMADQIAAYNRMKSAAFFDITGEAVDFGNPVEVEAAERSIGDKQIEQVNQKFVTALNKFYSGLFSTFEDIEGLVERFSFQAGEMFDGILRSLITNRFDNARRMNDIYNKFASSLMDEKAQEIWGKNFRKDLRRNATKRYEILLSNGKPMSMSMNQMYYIYNLHKDPANYDALNKMTHFQGDINGLMSQINAHLDGTPEGRKVKQWADWQVDELYPSLYEIYNPVYMRIYRTRMPWNRYYSGRIFRQGDLEQAPPVDLMGQKADPFITYIGGESTKVRKAFKKAIYMDADGGKDGDSVLLSYLNDMNFFASHAEVIRDTDKILKTNVIKRAIETFASKDVYDNLIEVLKSVQDVGFNYNSSDKRITKWLDKLFGNATRAKIALVPRIAVTQFTSIIGFIPYIGPVEWSKYFLKVIDPRNPSYLKELIANSPTIAKRYDTNEITRMISDFQSQRNSIASLDDVKKLSVYTLTPIRVGDKASLMGALPNYLYYKDQWLKKNPGDEQGAINYAASKVEPQVDKVAQSSASKDRSVAQNSNVYRYAFAFASAPLALARREMHALRNMFRILTGRPAKGTLVQNLGAFAIYHFAIPMLVAIAVKTPSILMGEWDEEDDDDLKQVAAFGNLMFLGFPLQMLYSLIERARGKAWGESFSSNFVVEELYKFGKLISDVIFNPKKKALLPADKAYLRSMGVDPKEYVKENGEIDEEAQREAFSKIILKVMDMRTGVGFENAGRFYENASAIIDGETEDVGDIFARLLNPPTSTFRGTGMYDKSRYSEVDLMIMRQNDEELYQRIIDENRGKK